MPLSHITPPKESAIIKGTCIFKKVKKCLYIRYAHAFLQEDKNVTIHRNMTVPRRMYIQPVLSQYRYAEN